MGNKGSARNYALESGVARFGRSAMYSKKAVYKFLKKKTAKKAAPAAKTFVEKKVGGAKNGGTRMVRVAKFPKEYPTEDPAAPSTSKSFFKKPQAFLESQPSARNHRHRLGRSPQGKARRRPQAIGHWSSLDHRPLQGQRLPAPPHQPEILDRHADQDRRLLRQSPRKVERQILQARSFGDQQARQEGGRHFRVQEGGVQGVRRTQGRPS